MRAVCTLFVQECTHMASITCCCNQQLSLCISTLLHFYLACSSESSYGEQNIIRTSIYRCHDIIPTDTVCFSMPLKGVKSETKLRTWQTQHTYMDTYAAQNKWIISSGCRNTSHLTILQWMWFDASVDTEILMNLFTTFYWYSQLNIQDVE